MMTKNVLIFGGTQEARELTSALLSHGLFSVTLSLAGALGVDAEIRFRQRLSQEQNGRLKIQIGGFGGVDGLSGFLGAHCYDVIVDATHPFATKMSTNAFEAANSANIPFARLTRQPWEQTQDDHWICVDDLSQAAEALAPNSRVFLAVGRQSISPFINRTDCWFLARSIAPLTVVDQHGHFESLLGTPNSSKEDEEALFAKHRIDCLVTKNAGGDASFSKVLATRHLGIPVIMVNRPALPECVTFFDIKSVLEWVHR